MRSAPFIVAAVGLAAAAPAPAPQEIDLDLAAALPNPTYTVASQATAQVVTYDPASILAAASAQITSTVAVVGPIAASASPDKVKRTACQAQPAGYGPVPTTDTASAFLNSPVFANYASQAATPSGYQSEFVNLQASNNAYGYMGFTTLQTYDVQGCANQCSAINGCASFNIYFERDPTVDPGQNCPNPPSTTTIKCVFWGGPVNAGNANNNGQYREEFQVVIAGSNGYTNYSIVAPAGYTTPNYLGNAAINAPYDADGCNTFLGSTIFTSGPFNISLCANACSQKSAYAVAHPPSNGSPIQTCQFFNTYVLYINNGPSQGQYCAMFSESWPSSYATNTGQWRGNSQYLVDWSYSSSNTTNPGQQPCASCGVAQASQAIVYSSLQPYCSSVLGYTTPSTTLTVTATSSPSSTVTITITSDIATTTTFTATVTSTIFAANQKRAAAPSALQTPTDLPLPPRSTPTTIAKRLVAERQVASTPNGLSQYPASIISSACSKNAQPVTSTNTITSTTTTTLPVVSVSTTATVITTTISTTTTVTATTTQKNCALATSFNIMVTDSGTPADGHTVNGLVGPYYNLGAGGFFGLFPQPIAFYIDSNSYLRPYQEGDEYHVAISTFSGEPTFFQFVSDSNDDSQLLCSIGYDNVLSCVSGANNQVSIWTGDGNYYGLLIGSSGTAVLTAEC